MVLFFALFTNVLEGGPRKFGRPDPRIHREFIAVESNDTQSFPTKGGETYGADD